MKVDVMTFGGSTYCYYSFVKGKNVCDANGREGAYFALTVRVNAFYADVQNMYNVLKATYDKMCVGLCVQDDGNSIKYLVPDFSGIDSKLKEMEKHLLGYIGEYSIGDDIVSLNGFSYSSQGTVTNCNLHECSKETALDIVKRTGKIVVSPWFPSASAARVISQLQNDLQATIQRTSQEIRMQQQASQEKIDAITRQSREELRECREEARKQMSQADKDCQEKIEEIKKSYSDVDATIKRMKVQIDAEKATAKEYKEKCDKMDKEIARNKTRVQKLETEYARLEDDYRQLSKGQPVVPRPRRINLWLVSGVSFFILLLLGSSIIFGVKCYSVKKEIQERDAQIEQMQTENDSLNKIVKGSRGQFGTSESVGCSQIGTQGDSTQHSNPQQEYKKGSTQPPKEGSEKATNQDATQTQTKEQKKETHPEKSKVTA
ncbi:hypothetical protein [Sodaliphilus sp.]|uniref:hypothetical protein n=1 Tax=Sodaliphilus sp. TaxID=2815818 RepID=UPI0038902AD4